MVASFLFDHPEFEIVEPPSYPGFGHGHPEWVETPDPLERVVRLWSSRRGPLRGPDVAGKWGDHSVGAHSSCQGSPLHR